MVNNKKRPKIKPRKCCQEKPSFTERTMEPMMTRKERIKTRGRRMIEKVEKRPNEALMMSSRPPTTKK